MCVSQGPTVTPRRSIPARTDTRRSWRGSGYRGRVPRRLVIAGCQSLCSWHATDERLGGEQLFACAGCGSEWVPSETWTPIDYEGVVPAPVAEARRARGGG